MNRRSMLGTFGGLLAVVGGIGIGGAALGCSAGAGGAGSDPQQEKYASTSQALIYSNPTTPYEFPTSKPDREADCSSVAPYYMLNSSYSGSGSPAWNYAENYIAYPVTDFSDDPYATAYSHYYSFKETPTLNAQLASDFFGIPNGNGYKYKVGQIIGGTLPRTLASTTQFWYLMGVNRADQSYLLYPPSATGSNPPWCVGGTCATGTDYFNTSSHPPYGSDGKSADWLELWNLAWTYSWGTPQDGQTLGPYNYTNPNTSLIQSTHHQCAFIYACVPGPECSTDPLYPVGCPSGFACQPDLNDPGETCQPGCYNPSTGTPFLADGVTFYRPVGLTPLDFFVAAEKHDPYGPLW